MCVAMPGKVISQEGRFALVDFNGNQVKALSGLVDAGPGDYVLVHAGCILQKVRPEEAKKLQDLMEDLGAYDQEDWSGSGRQDGSPGCPYL